MSWTPPPPPLPPGPTLVEAVQRRDAGRVGLLLARGVDPNADRSYALCVAAANGSVQLLRLLLDAGADVDARGGLPLVLSVDGGHLEAARLLLDRGAAPDALNGEALRLATRYGRQDIAELLLQRGAAPVQGPPATLPSGDAGQNPGNKENELPLAWERSV
jgi:ankyrin repeat protein